MKLSDVVESDTQPGTYAAVRFDNRTVAALEKFLKDNDIPNPNVNWHTTLLYSRKPLPKYAPIPKYTKPYVGTPTGFDFFGDDKNVLVITFSCPQLYQRHHKLMLQHGATYDFDKFEPHVTLSYDAKDVDLDSLPEFKRQLKIVGEYREELDSD